MHLDKLKLKYKEIKQYFEEYYFRYCTVYIIQVMQNKKLSLYNLKKT